MLCYCAFGWGTLSSVGFNMSAPDLSTDTSTDTDVAAGLAGGSDCLGGNQGKPAERVFSLAIVVSGIRCVLAYVIFPWVLPAVGVAGGVGAGAGLSIGAIAIAFNLVSIRRFWRVDHHHKWTITVLNVGVIVLLLILAAIDLRELLT